MTGGGALGGRDAHALLDGRLLDVIEVWPPPGVVTLLSLQAPDGVSGRGGPAVRTCVRPWGAGR